MLEKRCKMHYKVYKMQKKLARYHMLYYIFKMIRFNENKMFEMYWLTEQFYRENGTVDI